MVEFVIVVESSADFRIASEIAQRIFVEKIDWMDASHIAYVLKWCGVEEATDFTCWANVRAIYDQMKEQGIHLPRYLGNSGKNRKADGAAALKVLNMVEQMKKVQNRTIRAVVFIRDLDNQSERRSGLEQARQESANSSTVIVIGTADPKREAWVLNGFVPSDKNEKSIVADLQKELKFNPISQAHRLRESSFDEPHQVRNAKATLSKLTQDSTEREAQCWINTPLNLLRENGIHTGLTEYMVEVENRLVPLLQLKNLGD